jgi:DNA adenine methylase
MLENKKTQPINPAAPYIGGKRLLAKMIIPIIESIDHTSYAEPFVGMGGIFLRRTQIPNCEVINDYSKDIANFFRILQRHYVPFMDMLRFQLTTRADFERLLQTDPITLTDLERAARFLYLQRTSFGGKVGNRTFGVLYDGPARFNITKLVSTLEDIHCRLSRVVIECLHYSDFLEKYNRPNFLFYLDPPYYNCESDYGKGLFNKDDFKKLCKILKNISGTFIMSINDHLEIREIYKNFNISEVKTRYSVGTNVNKSVTELLISNRKLPL